MAFLFATRTRRQDAINLNLWIFAVPHNTSKLRIFTAPYITKPQSFTAPYINRPRSFVGNSSGPCAIELWAVTNASPGP